MKCLKKLLKDFDEGKKINKAEAVQLAGVFVSQPIRCKSHYVVYYPYNMKRFSGATAEYKTPIFQLAKEFSKLQKALLAATMLDYDENERRDVEVAMLKDSTISTMKALGSIKKYKKDF